jgi:NAD(P) transhydrogenase
VVSSKSRLLYSAKFIFVAVGSNPVAPPHIKVDGKKIHDSNSILSLKEFPKTLVVLGAGIIGAEYASMFATGGTKVYLVDRRDEILASVDREVVDHLVDRFNHQGMELLLKCDCVKIEFRSGTPVVHLSNGQKLKAEVVLVAQGRAGNTQDIGLEAVGIQPDARGLIPVDENYRTSVPSIYAVGDVVGAPALASTGMEQGRIACCHAFKVEDSGDYKMPKNFPYGIYTIPEISMVGKTEEDLIKSKLPYVTGKARYRELARGQIVGDRWGLLKLVVDKKTLKILGIHIVGDSAADLVHIGQAVMDLDGDVKYFIRTVFNYPTLAEAYKTAAFHAINQIKGRTKTR